MSSQETLKTVRGWFTSYIIVDLDAIAHNVRALCEHVGPQVDVYGVVKANAYGHGAPQVARTALENGAKRLAVGRTDEGVQLRRAEIGAKILNLCYTVPAEAEALIVHDIAATVCSMEGAQALSQRAGALGRQARVHVKVDSGMGRYGLLPDELLPFLEQATQLPNLDFEGIFTHFATADAQDKAYTRGQFARFEEVLGAAREAGYTFRVRHAANTAATLDLPATHLDAVRPGIALYGLYPSAEVSTGVALRPALSLHSHVGRVKTLPAGSGIGYGLTYTTTGPTRVALVPVGYGDGYHRLLSNRGSVLIGGRRAPIVGRVCMDQLMVDATGIDGVQPDDDVVLIGQQGSETIRTEEVAAQAETISYEIVTALLPRLPRIYVKDGQVVDVVQLTTCN